MAYYNKAEPNVVSRFFSKSIPHFLWILSLITNAYGQSVRQSFHGNYFLTDSISGSASFEYRVENGDTLKDGRFSFQHFTEHYHETDSVYGLVLTGYLKDNIKNGSWFYSSKKLAITGGLQTLGARVIYDASGKEFLANAHFEDGRASGVYELVYRNIKESVSTDTTFYSKMEYEDGQIAGALEGFTENIRIRGQFDNEGFPDGDWVITHKPDSGSSFEEIRRYDRGFFSRHYYKVDDRLMEIRHIGFDTLAKAGRGLLTRLPATSTYFRALDYTNIVMDTSAVHDAGNHGNFQENIARTNAFLERVFTRPADYHVQNIWKSVEGSEAIPAVRVKISKFSFTSEEQKLNSENEKLLLEAQSLIGNFFNNPKVELERFTSRELSFYYQVLTLYRDRLVLIEPVIRFLADEASEYVDPPAILAHNAVDIRYPTEVEYLFQERNVTDHHRFPDDLIVFNTLSLNQHLVASLADISGVVEKVEGILDGFLAQSNLSEKEQGLISLRDSVFHVFFGKESEGAHNSLQMAVRDTLVSSVGKAFKTYAELTTYERLSEVEALESCFKTYVQFYQTLAVFQDRLHQLDKDYTRTVWNPYTFTNMDERVKERLYSAFERVLFPAVWDGLKKRVSCRELPVGISSMDALLSRMAELRLEDTKELERKIKKARPNAQSYAEILGLNLKF